HFREYNDLAPDICFGFDAAPGHQASGIRGGYDAASYEGTYGGFGWYSTQLGGLWDALLGEGRRWFAFGSSDYHGHHTIGLGDFYPGEYQKNWTTVLDLNGDNTFDESEIVHGMRSGNTFVVTGDLINALEFSASYGGKEAIMGSGISVPQSSSLNLVIKFKSPATNNNGDAPIVDHIDLIAGDITGKIDSSSPDYTKATNESTSIITTFTATDWQLQEGWYVVTHVIPSVNASRYFRLRGTNHPPNTPHETDGEGNPLLDSLVTDNLAIDEEDEAWRDLWFYSNPVYVYTD
ncbi:hypothetical protein BVY04_04790, partial [bacterium M21]